MEVTVLFFGLLAEVSGTESAVLKDISNTDALMRHLCGKYPVLQNKKYRIAVNKKLTMGKLGLNDGDVVALLPPFAGG